ncbi:MAG: hypothetical protein LV479_00840 [Methylacidiphilales bacterium]|nr:hypothetical protein [Candidatus Methylacidiphilales bacterium]
MDQNQDFSKLRALLSLQRVEIPADTDRFLIEFHRRQRAQLLVPESLWARAFSWLKERVAGLDLVPSVSYAAAFAAIAITAVVGLSQQVQVTETAGHVPQLSFHLPARDASFAMLPASFGANAASKLNESANLSRSDSTPTQFVLATNPHRAYDATVAF